jgi:hypothetical protein
MGKQETNAEFRLADFLKNALAEIGYYYKAA